MIESDGKLQLPAYIRGGAIKRYHGILQFGQARWRLSSIVRRLTTVHTSLFIFGSFNKLDLKNIKI
jgi:hypothetical protein